MSLVAQESTTETTNSGTYTAYDPVLDAEQQMARMAERLGERRDWLNKEIGALELERRRVTDMITRLTGRASDERRRTTSTTKTPRHRWTCDPHNLAQTQREILDRLAVREPQSVRDLSVGSDVQTVGNHVRVMTDAGVLVRRLMKTEGIGRPFYLYARSDAAFDQ